MKRNLIIFLQIGISLIGLVVFVFLLLGPHFEGRNINATIFQIYFQDPFLACVYISSMPFFVGLYQVFKALSLIRRNKIFSAETIRSARIIKFCALLTIGFVALGEVYIIFHNSDDRAGGVFMGILIALFSVMVAVSAALFEWIIQKVLDLDRK